MLVAQTCIINLKVLVLLMAWQPAKCVPDWTYELISIKMDSDNPSVLQADLQITRISRGQFALSGSLNVGEDLNEQTSVRADVYYSFSGHDYVRSPLRISKTTLPNFMQTFYKDILLDSLLACTTNTPDLAMQGVVTKRLVEFENCEISNENLPSHLKVGYYKILLIFTDQVEATMEVIAKVEKKD